MKKILGIGMQLVALVSLPLMILAFSLVFFTTTNLREKMNEEVGKGLENIAYSLTSFYERTYEGDYTISTDGIVSKGDLIINDQYMIMDDIKNRLHTDVTFFYGDTRIATTVINDKGERAIGTKAADVVKEEVLQKGNSYFDPQVQVNGKPYYGYYVPLVNADGTVVGMIFAGKSNAEVTAQIRESVTKNITIAIIILVLSMAITIFFVAMIIHSIKGVVRIIREVSDGNLKAEVPKRTLRRKDEIGDIGRSIDTMEEKFKKIVAEIKTTAQQLSSSAKQLEANSDTTATTMENINHAMIEIAKGANEQAEETQSSTKNMSDMGELIHKEMISVEELLENATGMKKAEEEAGVYIASLVEANDKTLLAVQRIEEQTYTTNESVQHIRQAVDMISAIARETNLLSLNASIEAARAGEHGRGFAVVAQQIQKLAEESNRSAKEIEVVINKLSNESEQSIVVMEEVKERVEKQINDLQKTKSKFDEVRGGIIDSTQNIQEVEGQSTTIDKYRGVVIEALENLSAISEENAASTEETTASIEEVNAMMEEFNNSAKILNEMAEHLEKEVEIFKL